MDIDVVTRGAADHTDIGLRLGPVVEDDRARVWTNRPSPNANSRAFATSTRVLCGLDCGSFTSSNPSSSSIGSSSSRKP